MKRLKIIAGNWKMNLEAKDARDLYSAIVSMDVPEGVKVIVSPPGIYLSEFAKIPSAGAVLAAQNCSNEDVGAYTGEVSAKMLKSLGLGHVILGHSERRELYGDTDKIVGEKVLKAIQNGLSPIFCCGELLEERENNEQEMVVANQIREGLFNLTVAEIQKVIIAYEPVWAIGTGKTASAKEAQEMHAFIRSIIAKRYGDEVGNGLSILYGGSVKVDNAETLFSCPDVDGALIGGASLKAFDFQKIVSFI